MRTIKVWDIFVRSFHWIVVLIVAEQFITADDFHRIHVFFGYCLIGLVLARIVWGFVGTKYARFSEFVHGPKAAIGYLKSLADGRPKHYIGHNPAGGMMVVILLCMLLVTAFAGLKALAAEGKGPFAETGPSLLQSAYAHDDEHETDRSGGSYEDGREENEQADSVWEEIHEAMAGILLFLIAVHICGVLVSSRVHGENLILSMITGEKKVTDGSEFQ